MIEVLFQFHVQTVITLDEVFDSDSERGLVNSRKPEEATSDVDATLSQLQRREDQMASYAHCSTGTSLMSGSQALQRSAKN